MEENGSLAIGEKGCRNGQIPEISAHPNFRIFLTMDPRDGDLSPAMRNRGVEIFTHSTQNDEKMLECSTRNESTISGEDFIKFGNTFVIWRQFCLLKNDIEIDPDRAVMAFLNCGLKDWYFR